MNRKIVCFLLLISVLVITGCQKGEEINSFTALSTVQFAHKQAEGYEIKIGKETIPFNILKKIIRSDSVEVSVVSLTSKTEVLKQYIKLEENTNKFTLLKMDPADEQTVVLMKGNGEIEGVVPEPGKIKVKFVNYNKELASNEESIHLVFQELKEFDFGMFMSVYYDISTDTVFNVSRKVPQDYAVIPVKRPQVGASEFVGRFLVLKTDKKPFLKDGEPVYLYLQSSNTSAGIFISTIPDGVISKKEDYFDTWTPSPGWSYPFSNFLIK
ncbi:MULTISPECIES: hypothetical protein [unclassified Sphingobacterium]|uniref:hypothetical protein n=1 Tax=unclassified Sphingobacterium TaxID=2609468 RepID=UPI0025DA16FE|nr:MULTISPECIES: hypothetical protein [unclassified Sphingobacterium]